MWLKIENEQLLSIFKVGTMDKNTGFFMGWIEIYLIVR
jgi:hypothetical protein